MDEITIKALVGVFAIITTLILFFVVYVLEYKKHERERRDNLRMILEINENLESINESLRCISWEFTGLREDLEERSKKE